MASGNAKMGNGGITAGTQLVLFATQAPIAKKSGGNGIIGKPAFPAPLPIAEQPAIVPIKRNAASAFALLHISPKAKQPRPYQLAILSSALEPDADGDRKSVV